MRRTNILTQLQGGDRRSIGRADRVAAKVSRDPRQFAALMGGLWAEDPLIRMRAADAVEKVTRKRPELLWPYKKELLGLLAEATEQEVRWHLAVMVPRLKLGAKEREAAMSHLLDYLQDRSSIVRTLALQGLANLAHGDRNLQGEVTDILRETLRKGTPAMKARSRKLLAQL